MALSLRPRHLKRYKDIARLLTKYGGADVLRGAGLDDALDPDDLDTTTVPGDPDELAADLDRLGPTYVKVGQLLSTRPDLLPAPYVAALSRLQDKCEPLPFEQIAAVVEDELGARISKAFAEFDPTPLAAASLGQVHRAALRDGRPVAVKVQRPGIRDQVVDDLDALTEIAAFADRHSEAGRRVGFEAMVEEFRRSMLRELDYRREAQNLRTLRRNLEPFDRIVVPEPVGDYGTATVLTMTYIAGRKVTDVGPLGVVELDGEALVRQLFAAYLKQILVDGFFHADPHPGNVFVTDDGRLALLDLGMVAHVAPALQDQLIKLLLAVSDGDGAEAAEVLQELGESRPDVAFDEALFTRRVADLVLDYHDAALGQASAGLIVAQLARIAGEAGLRPPPELTMLGKALLNLDEVARHLAPEFSAEAALRDEVAHIVRRRMLQSVSPRQLLSSAMDAKEFAEKLPARVNKVMESLAEGRLTLHVTGIDSEALMENLRRVANRITMGLVLAALIVGAAMLMRVETSSKLFGYPAVAIVLFLVAAGAAVALLVTIAVDRRRRE